MHRESRKNAVRLDPCAVIREVCSLNVLKITLAASILGAATGVGAAQLSEFGENDLQTATGGAVQVACGKMIPIADTLRGDQLQLFFRCGELVQTGNDLSPDDPGGTGNSLQISSEELAEALQNVAPEETESLGAGLTDTSQDQLAGLQNRLQFLRTGTSTMPIAGINWSGEDIFGGTAGADSFSRLGGFVTGIYATGDRGEVNRSNGVQNAFDFDAYGFTAGLDYRFTDSLIFGAALGYIESEVEFDRNYGKNDTEGVNYSLYGTWYGENIFVEGSLAYGDYEYDMQRFISYANNNPNNPSMGQDIDQTVKSSTDGESVSWTLGVGYNFTHQQSNFTLMAKLAGLDADIDAYAESGSELAMEIGDQDVESLQSIFSAQAAYNFSRDFGVLVPYASVSWYHEFEDDARDISARYVFDPNKDDAENVLVFTTDPGDEDYYLVSLGVNFVLTQGNQIFFNYDTLLGLNKVDSHAVTLGLRIEF